MFPNFLELLLPLVVVAPKFRSFAVAPKKASASDKVLVESFLLKNSVLLLSSSGRCFFCDLRCGWFAAEGETTAVPFPETVALVPETAASSLGPQDNRSLSYQMKKLKTS